MMDPKTITADIPDVIRDGHAQRAFQIVGGYKHGMPILPEVLMLFNTPGIAPYVHTMLQKVFAQTLQNEPGTISALADCSAALGRYGFSFPIWRHLTQSFNGASLMERFQYQRLKRDTDLRDANLPDPARDEFGVGFVREREGWYLEYRRAYIACSNTQAEALGHATIIIRNNSYFYGRDRLPEPVYVSWDRIPYSSLRNLTPADFISGKFVPWQNALRSKRKLKPELKAARVKRLLKYMDAHEYYLSEWLFREDDRGGLKYLTEFLHLRQQTKPEMLPFIGKIDAHLPPWFPKAVVAVTPDVLVRLGNMFATHDRSEKIVLLSGKQGDFPIRPAPSPAMMPR